MRLQRARDELAESLAALGAEAYFGYEDSPEFFHVRLSPERARVYRDRLSALTADLLHETPDPEGTVFAVSVAFFVAPPSMQVAAESRGGWMPQARRVKALRSKRISAVANKARQWQKA